MLFSEHDEKYLNRQGLNYLVQELEKKFANSGTGTVDLSNYYNKEEVDTLISNFGENSGTDGQPGADGEDGIGIEKIELVNYELIITLTDGTVTNYGSIRGADGEKGVQGEQGVQGEKGADGINGTNGVSPTVTVTKEGNVATITCTDVNGTTTATISDGQDGASGSGGSTTGGTSTEIYSTEETPIGVWIDGSTIYRKVVTLDLPDITSGYLGTTQIVPSHVKCFY